MFDCRECTRGGFCNFMHLKPISYELRRELYNRDHPWRKGDRKATKKRSSHKKRRRKGNEKSHASSGDRYTADGRPSDDDFDDDENIWRQLETFDGGRKKVRPIQSLSPSLYNSRHRSRSRSISVPKSYDLLKRPMDSPASSCSISSTSSPTAFASARHRLMTPSSDEASSSLLGLSAYITNNTLR